MILFGFDFICRGVWSGRRLEQNVCGGLGLICVFVVDWFMVAGVARAGAVSGSFSWGSRGRFSGRYCAWELFCSFSVVGVAHSGFGLRVLGTGDFWVLITHCYFELGWILGIL